MQRPLLQKIVSVNDRTPVASRRLKIVEAVFSSHSLANFLPKLKVTDSWLVSGQLMANQSPATLSLA